MALTDYRRMTGKELRELERTDPDEYARIKRKMENFDGPAERLVWLWDLDSNQERRSQMGYSAGRLALRGGEGCCASG